ncbi:asparagine synthase-related protein [Polyangium mundeleinium]|uniref:asparagine synthase (glutamine-hydrolyzing) n=1 Tax=Polyangium mundeleinium TaxID=2995306 RepID=A0ABT5F2T3_9BACT|nr:asparagine synthase-related protein [Polyangium mundeleinium]MDC0748393.1 asparagine synthase-related protein [Polyangium mundeleinium]
MNGSFGYVSGRPGSPIDEARFSPNAVTSADGRFTLVFEGDRETPEGVLAAYAARGKRAIEELRGGFALGLWDATERTLLLARDPIGIKSLYFATAHGKLAFASEVWTLAAQGFAEKRLSRRAVASFLATGAVAEPDTILEGVSPLPPATILTYREGHTRSATYWKLPSEPGTTHAAAPLEAALAETLSTPATPPLAPDEREITEAIEALDQPSTSFPQAFRAAKSAGEAAFSGLGRSALFPAASRLLHFGALFARDRSVERAYAGLRCKEMTDALAAASFRDGAIATHPSLLHLEGYTLLPVRIPEELEPSLARRKIRLDRALAVLDLANDLHGTALRDADLACRRHGLLLRAPLLDRAVVEHALGLPLRGALRHTRARSAPAPPLAAWLRGPLRAWAERTLLDEARRYAPFLDAHVLAVFWRGLFDDKGTYAAPNVFAWATLIAYLKSHDATI